MKTNNSISKYEKGNHPKLSQISSYGICSKGPKNEFETAVVNEPSVFEPLKFYCIEWKLHHAYLCINKVGDFQRLLPRASSVILFFRNCLPVRNGIFSKSKTVSN